MTEIKKLEAIICDFDDTLIPTSEIGERAINAAVDAIILKGIDIPRDKIFLEYMKVRKELGSKNKEHLDVMFERLGITKVKANEFISAARRAYHFATMALMPFHDVPQTLYKLKELGYRLYIATDGDSKDQWDKIHALQSNGFDKKIFDRIYTNEDYQFKTKCPEFYQMILNKESLEAKRCLIIGDKMDSDIRPGRICELITARVLTGRHGEAKYEDEADYVIPRFSDILTKLEKIEKKL